MEKCVFGIKDCTICNTGLFNDEDPAAQESGDEARQGYEEECYNEPEVEEAESVTLYRIRRLTDGFYYRTHIWNRHWDRTGTFMGKRGLGAVKGYLQAGGVQFEVERYDAFRNDE